MITIALDDPSEKSFLEFVGSMSDLKWNTRIYERSLEQNRQLGLAPAKYKEENAVDEVEQQPGDPDEEVFEFPGVCSRSSCSRSLVMRIKKVSIPYFKVRIEVTLNLHA
jgi:zinc finger protein